MAIEYGHSHAIHASEQDTAGEHVIVFVYPGLVCMRAAFHACGSIINVISYYYVYVRLYCTYINGKQLRAQTHRPYCVSHCFVWSRMHSGCFVVGRHCMECHGNLQRERNAQQASSTRLPVYFKCDVALRAPCMFGELGAHRNERRLEGLSQTKKTVIEN